MALQEKEEGDECKMESTSMLKNHVKIGSAILNREYFWSMACDRCKVLPEVYYRPDEDSPKQRSARKEPTAPAAMCSICSVRGCTA